MRPQDYSREPDEIQVVIYKNSSGVFLILCFPYKAESYNLTCSHVYGNTRQYICLLLHRLILDRAARISNEAYVHEW